MKVSINEEELNVNVEGTRELCSSVTQTVFYFVGVADWKTENIEKAIKQLPEPLKHQLDKSDRAKKKGDNGGDAEIKSEIVNIDVENGVREQKNASRAPNNTTLFLMWLEKIRYRDFDITEFMKRYDRLTQEMVQKIISYQIAQGNILQLSGTKFKVVQQS